MQQEAPTTPDLAITPVATSRDWRDFFALAQRINGGDPAWIAPLTQMRRRQWSHRNPWHRHGRARAWLARRDGQAVGCISAQVDELHERTWGEKLGYFGQLEAIDDHRVFHALLNTAATWLRDQGMTLMRGPYDLSVNQTCGLLVEGFDSPPMMMMGHAPPYYATRLEDAGLSPAMDLLAYRVPPRFGTPPPVARILDRLGDRLRVRPLDRARFAEEMTLLRDIFNDAWSSNWGFVPFTEAEFHQLGKDIRPLAREGYIQIAELDGEAAAFIAVLPNFNEYIRDFRGRLLPFNWAKLLWRLRRPPLTARVPLMGVRMARQKGIAGSALAFSVIEAARQPVDRDGVQTVELSWILETNKGMRSILEAIGAEVYKRYRIYQRSLP